MPDSPIPVALVGCPDLAARLEAADDLEIASFDHLSALLDGARGLQPRVCFLGPASAEETARSVQAVRRGIPFTDVLVWHPGAPATVVRAALLAGAKDVVFEMRDADPADRVRRVAEEQTLLPAVLEHEDRVGGTWRFEGLVSRNSEMWDVFETCIRTAATPASVLILGETGTGKDLVARAIHRRSGRSGRFVALNCGAVPDTLIDSELFGHVEGAFTGAVGTREGLFRHAHGGTLLLDEIGNLPVGSQNRLLRALQAGTVRPVGGTGEIEVDVRVIAATSVSLEEAIEAGQFREDLFYRLDVIRLILPPLRRRPEDVVFLLGHFARDLAEQYNVERPRMSEEFLDAVQAHDWPGNVRELENFVERLLLTHTGETLQAAHFRELMRGYRGREEPRGPSPRGPVAAPDRAADIRRPLARVVDEAVERVERAYLEALLAETSGRIGKAAEQAGISRRTLLRKLRRWGIAKERFRD